MPLLNHRTILKVAVALLATATFAACFDHTTFFNYHAIAPEGWDKPDFQEYNVDPIETDGYYVEEIGLRTSSAYPFRRIHLVVRQDIISTTGTHPSRFRCDTVRVDIYDSWGKSKGRGVDLRQHVIPLKTLSLKAGDSLSVRISHDMSAFTLQGVSDIGLKVTRQ